MPVDYSKWDALELSDDSDIEVHPNVDKRSFIRAKQHQIHQQRLERKHRIETLKYEKLINDGLLLRVEALLKAVESHKFGDADDVVFDCLTEVTHGGSLGDDMPPPPPGTVHGKEEPLSYSHMVGVLVDQVKASVDKTSGDRFEAYKKEIASHRDKIQGLNDSLLKELDKLEKEDKSKITSESIHTGFDSTRLSKPSGAAAVKEQERVPELLNPKEPAGSEADVEDDEDVNASELAKQFAKIKVGDFASSLQFIGKHSDAILKESQSDGLLAEAFMAQSKAKTQKDEDYARQCVHQALLLQYCRQLGKDGVGIFFKRMQDPKHAARKIFLDDVNTTYNRIRTRTAEIEKQADEGSREVERIQLHAFEPNSKIVVTVPPEKPTTDAEREARRFFDAFPPNLQTALVSGDLDKVNDVLGKMAVDEAEIIVEQLSEGGMLNMEKGVIDATTEEGQKRVEEIEAQKKEGELQVEEMD